MRVCLVLWKKIMEIAFFDPPTRKCIDLCYNSLELRKSHFSTWWLQIQKYLFHKALIHDTILDPIYWIQSIGYDSLDTIKCKRYTIQFIVSKIVNMSHQIGHKFEKSDAKLSVEWFHFRTFERCRHPLKKIGSKEKKLNHFNFFSFDPIFFKGCRQQCRGFARTRLFWQEK